MNLIPYVNIRMGTASHPRFSQGNTLPYTQLPWAMAGFMPQTDGNGGGWFFHSDHRCIEGIRLTHQPSPWIGDYGTFLMTPIAEKVFERYDGSWSGYRPQEATFRPDLLKVRFLRQRCDAELAPTERGAALRLHFDMLRNHGLTFYPLKGQNRWEYDRETNTLFGFTDGHSQDKPKNFGMHIAVRFEEGAVNTDTSRAFDCMDLGQGFHVMLNEADVTCRLAISYISREQALQNLEQELLGRSFEEIQKQAEDIWEEYLHRIEIETDNEEQKRTFYSCLYRTALFPHKAYELDRDGSPIHLSPFTGKVHPGVRYTDNGFWDTYRTVYPLYALIAKKEYAEMLEGFVADYREGGWLPRWPSFGEVGCMPSTLIDAVIADAAVKGIGSRELLETAFAGMLNHANQDAPENRYGRTGASLYLKYGYMPRELVHESVNLTLDSAYGDWCIARVAQVLGKDPALVAEYDRRAKNYQNLFDKETGFMRGRDVHGTMREDFDPLCWGDEYTEGCAWQSTFAVPHDVDGLADLYGGREAMYRKLDELFATKPEYRITGYGYEIHEMTEMAAVDFGQCAISNQPSFHLPFLYAMLGQQEKANRWVRDLCTVFSSANGGYPGDEDNGTMSAWYIFAQLGIYPVCPGMPGNKGYALSEPLVSSAKILGKAWNHERIEEYI